VAYPEEVVPRSGTGTPHATRPPQQATDVSTSVPPNSGLYRLRNPRSEATTTIDCLNEIQESAPHGPDDRPRRSTEQRVPTVSVAPGSRRARIRKAPLLIGWINNGALRRKVRRRPTLPHRNQCSTIGAEELSFRVRNGTGRFLLAITTGTRSDTTNMPTRKGCAVRGLGTTQWMRLLTKYFVGKPSAY
jgi:hypothetical protein